MQANSTDWDDSHVAIRLTGEVPGHRPLLVAAAPRNCGAEWSLAWCALAFAGRLAGCGAHWWLQRWCSRSPAALRRGDQRLRETTLPRWTDVASTCCAPMARRASMASVKRRPRGSRCDLVVELGQREHDRVRQLRPAAPGRTSRQLWSRPRRGIARRSRMATTSLEDGTLRQLTARLKATQEAVLRHYPGEAGQRQPVHTVYGGAHLFKSDTARTLGELALKALGQYGPSATVFADAIGVDPGIAETVFTRVQEKLRREVVEDFRIDFEDGYGNRADAEEDRHASQAAAATAKGLRDGTLSPFIGIRIKTLSSEVAARALRTLDIYLTALLRETGGKLPANFVVTLPKITSSEQVGALIDAFEALEPALGLPAGSLQMEPMIETTQSILDQDGTSMLPKLLRAARGRMVAAHFGTYDYTASCNITAAYQHMRHPACDFAKQMMQVAYAGTGIWLSDGATSILPVPIHRG